MEKRSAATAPRNLTHCSECDRPFPQPVADWDDVFQAVEDASYVCEDCATEFEGGFPWPMI